MYREQMLHLDEVESLMETLEMSGCEFEIENSETCTLYLDVDDYVIHMILRQMPEEMVYVMYTKCIADIIDTMDNQYNFPKAKEIIFGCGSGEEFHDYVMQNGMSLEDADRLIELLRRA